MKQIFEEMYDQYKVRITLDKNYSSLPKTACHDAYFIEDTDICVVCGNRSLAVCPECGGSGDIIGTVHSWMIDIPYRRCPNCFGTGKVEVE